MIASYLWTKSIAAGVLLVAALVAGAGYQQQKMLLYIASPALAVVFTAITVLLLILDLKRPERFFYLLIKPNLKSWLVLGGYILILYGGAATLCLFFGARGIPIPSILFWVAAVLAVASACYSAFLFAQAKGRDLWQSPLFLWHLLVQAITAGAATLIIGGAALQASPDVIVLMSKMLGISLTFTLALVLGEVFLTPVTEDVSRATDLLKRGSLSRIFWGIMVGVGVLLPLALLLFSAIQTDASWLFPVVASVLALMGLWVFEDLWIKAGQAVPLS
jgi:formate-dependent nitrite reductase membrane component NrfD